MCGLYLHSLCGKRISVSVGIRLLFIPGNIFSSLCIKQCSKVYYPFSKLLSPVLIVHNIPNVQLFMMFHTRNIFKYQLRSILFLVLYFARLQGEYFWGICLVARLGNKHFQGGKFFSMVLLG